MRPARLLVTSVVAGSLALAAACGGTIDAGTDTGGGTPSGAPAATSGGPTPGDCRAVESGEISIVAEGIAYDTTCIEAPAGEPFTIRFENRDGVAHDIMIEDAAGATVIEGDNVTQGTIDYAIPALAAGEYPFHCHIHASMHGVLRVG